MSHQSREHKKQRRKKHYLIWQKEHTKRMLEEMEAVAINPMSNTATDDCGWLCCGENFYIPQEAWERLHV